MIDYTLRTSTDQDLDFLKKVHHVTLKPYVEKIWGWEESQQDLYVLEDFKTGQIQIII